MTSPIQADDPHMLQDELWLAMELCISYLGLILTDLHVLHQLHTPLPPGLKYTRRSALCCLVSLKFPVVACWLLLVAACNPDAICLQSRHNLIPVFPPSISLARSLLPYLARSLPPSLSRSVAPSFSISLPRSLPRSRPPSLASTLPLSLPSLAPSLPRTHPPSPLRCVRIGGGVDPHAPDKAGRVVARDRGGVRQLPFIALPRYD